MMQYVCIAAILVGLIGGLTTKYIELTQPVGSVSKTFCTDVKRPCVSFTYTVR